MRNRKEEERERRRRESYKTNGAAQKVLDRRLKGKSYRLGAIGEPGRFSVIGRGQRTGVHHFSV